MNQEWYIPAGFHAVMDEMETGSDEYNEALEVLADPGSEKAENFFKKHGLAPATPKPPESAFMKICY